MRFTVSTASQYPQSGKHYDNQLSFYIYDRPERLASIQTEIEALLGDYLALETIDENNIKEISDGERGSELA